MQKAIVVVGMHRSGTSAVSGLLDELGVNMGKTLYGPQKGVNEKGFFENAKVVEINDQLFDQLLQSWDDPFAYNFTGNYDEKYQNFENSTQAFLKKEYGVHAIWGMKDPRVSLHLPFWHKMIAKNKVTPCYLMMVRNPNEVASSLAKRDAFSLQKGLMLWLNYTFSTYLFCKKYDMCVIDFNSLLNAPDRQLEKICGCFELDLPITKSSFIEKELRNMTSGNINDSELGDLALEVYNLLQQPKIDDDKVQLLLQQYIEFLRRFEEVVVEHCRAIKSDEVYFRRLFLQAYNSFWWKVSWPLRVLERKVRTKPYIKS